MGTWLLVETFGGLKPPTVIGVGNAPKAMVSLSSVLGGPRSLGQGRYLADVRALVARVSANGDPVRTPSGDRQRLLVAEPLRTYGGRVHGVAVWVGGPEEHVAPRDPAGAFHVSLTDHTSARSDDLLDLYGAAGEKRVNVHDLAELFAHGRLVTASDEARALALLVRSEPGTEHHATWTVQRDDGELRAGAFSCRVVVEPGPNGPETFVRGITHDIGPAERVRQAPPPKPILLAQQVLAAEQRPGRWRGIVDLRNMRLLRWLDEPHPTIAWQLDAPLRGVHRRDVRLLRDMAEQLTDNGTAAALLRFRDVDGGWVSLHVRAQLMALDKDTTAALVTLTDPAAANPFE